LPKPRSDCASPRLRAAFGEPPTATGQRPVLPGTCTVCRLLNRSRRFRAARRGWFLFRGGFGEFSIDLSGLDWVNAMIVGVRLRQVILIHKQRVEPLAAT